MAPLKAPNTCATGVIIYIMYLMSMHCSPISTLTTTPKIIPDVDMFKIEREHVRETYLQEGTKGKYSAKTLLRLFFWLEEVENDVLLEELANVKELRRELENNKEWSGLTDRIFDVKLKLYEKRKDFLKTALTTRRNMPILIRLSMTIRLLEKQIETLDQKRMLVETKLRSRRKKTGTGLNSDTFNGYAFILDTICLEIVDTKNVDPNLIEVLNSFLNSEYFMKWTDFCCNVLDEEPKLSVAFETIPVPVSAIAESWKKFIQVVTRQCKELIDKPAVTAFPIFENLTQELSVSEISNKEKFLCDIYRIYLTTWKSDCSETSWQDELILTSNMFIVLNKYKRQYNPYFYSAILEIGYKILKYGKEHIQILNESKDKSEFLLACGEILNQKLEDYSKLVQDGNDSIEYPPLLLHLCILKEVMENIDIPDDLIVYVINETDFVNFVLKTTNKILKISCETKTAKSLLQFQTFIFEKYPFLKENYYFNEAILNVFYSVFPNEFPNDPQVFLDSLIENGRSGLFRFGINFVVNLTKQVTCESKNLLVEFGSKNKQYLFSILRMISVSQKKEILLLVTAVVKYYYRLTQHLFYCKYSEVNDLVEAMFLIFNCVKFAISTYIQPSKMCSLLLNVPLHHLQQFLEESDNISNIRTIIPDTYDKLLHIIKLGIQTLSTFCINAESILCGTWPPEDWSFRWLSKVKSKSDSSFPILLLDLDNLHDDFTILAAFVTLEHRALTNRMKIESPRAENLSANRLMIMNHDCSGQTLLELSYFLFSQSAMYLLHPQVDQSKKLFFVNHIFVNLKEFIKNAINDFTNDEIILYPAINDFETFKLQKPVKIIDGGKSDAGKSDSPVPTKQVLSLRGGDSKSSSIQPPSETDKSADFEGDDGRCLSEEDVEKIRAATLHTIATLFYKLITTFKHS